jgi:hypothetical protein
MSGPLFVSYRNDKLSECTKTVQAMTVDMKEADSKADEAITLADTSLKEECMGDKAFKAYRDACISRRELSKLWWNPLDEALKDADADASKDGEVAAPAVQPVAGAKLSPVAKQQTLRGVLGGMPASERPVTDLKTMYTKAELDDFVDKLPGMDSPVKVEDAVDQFKIFKRTFDQYLKAYKKSALDIKGYLTTKARQAQRETEKTKKDAEKQELAATKAKAREAADIIKKSEQHRGAIFSIPANKWLGIPDVTVGAVFSQNAEANMDKPWMIKGSDVVKTWREMPSIILKLSEYGGSYKKIGAANMKEDGRTQSLMSAQNGKEETDAVLAKIVPLGCQVDISGMQSGSNFMQSTWMFGYSPDMCGCWPTPNSASMLKLLAHGQVQVLAFSLVGLPEFFKLDSMDDICKALIKAKVDEVDGLVGSSPGYFGVMEAGDALHVPAGWVVCERCTGGALIYGVRKSWVPDSLEAKQLYKTIIDILRKSNRNPSKLEEVVAIMEKC